MDLGLRQRSSLRDPNFVYPTALSSGRFIVVGQGGGYRYVLPIGATPLTIAAHSGQIDVVNKLLDAGADTNEEVMMPPTVREAPTLSRSAHFSLHAAVLNDDIPMIEALLAKGADPFKKCYTDGTNMLFHAYSDKVVALLLEWGVDATAQIHGRWWIASHRLLIKGQVFLQSKEYSVYKASEAVVRALISKGADINAGDNDGETFLHALAGKGDHGRISSMVSLGANLAAANNEGNTPLHEACMPIYGVVISREIIKMLLSQDSVINLVNNKGQTWAPEINMAEPHSKCTPKLVDESLGMLQVTKPSSTAHWAETKRMSTPYQPRVSRIASCYTT